MKVCTESLIGKLVEVLEELTGPTTSKRASSSFQSGNATLTDVQACAPCIKVVIRRPNWRVPFPIGPMGQSWAAHRYVKTQSGAGGHAGKPAAA